MALTGDREGDRIHVRQARGRGGDEQAAITELLAGHGEATSTTDSTTPQRRAGRSANGFVNGTLFAGSVASRPPRIFKAVAASTMAAMNPSGSARVDAMARSINAVTTRTRASITALASSTAIWPGRTIRSSIRDCWAIAGVTAVELTRPPTRPLTTAPREGPSRRWRT